MNTKDRREFIKSLGLGIALPHVNVASQVVGQKDPIDFRSMSSEDSESFWKLVKSQFVFADQLQYFNNASLGGSPLSVQNMTTTARNILDAFPSKYMWGGWKEEKETVRNKVATLLSVSPEEIALIHNTTEGMNLIARSFNLNPGDEIILADHEHTSGRICWEVFQEARGVKIVRPELPILPEDDDEIIELYRKAITPQTKIISMCHIVNTNGMMLPVKAISEMAHQHGILVAVDGAQSAGMIDIDLHDMACDFYTASAHKWLFAPKGTGILYAKESSQHQLHPLVVCRGYTDKTIRRLENYNTRNLPEVLGLGAAIDFINSIGIDKIEKRSYDLKKYFRNKVSQYSTFKLKTPAPDTLSSAIQVLEVLNRDVKDAKDFIFKNNRIDCRPMSTFGLNAMRFSFAIYITKEDIDDLVEALVDFNKT